MLIDYETFQERADRLRERMAAACLSAGRDPREVRLLPVTKSHPPDAAGYAARYGLPAVGENRVQEAVAKRAAVGGALRWELIGHLQSNKARLAAAHFDRVQSVDSVRLAGLLGRAATELGRVLPVLLQINAGHDPAKFGAEPADAPALLEAALSQPGLRVEGLMAIAPLGADPATTRGNALRTFAALRTLRDDLAARSGVALPELSMGMTGDFAEAISEGSTLIRVGTALYGPRE